MRKAVTFIFALVTSVLLNSKVYAIWPDFTPAIPVAPQLCAMCIASDIPLVLEYVEQAKAMKDKYMSYLNTSYWKQKFSSYVSRLGGAAFGALLKKAGQREKFLSYARSIKDSKVANLSNETDVQEVYVKLFFQYPSDKPSVMSEYEDMGRQFQMDSAIEAVVATKGMKTELEKMRQDLAKIEKCLMEGQGCSEMGMQDCSASQSGGGSSSEDDKEDNSCMWNNANTAILMYDKIMRYNENLVYMMSQYKAVQGIGGLARIRPYSRKNKDKKKKGLFGQIKVIPEQGMYAEVSSSAAFADESEDEEFSDYIKELTTRDDAAQKEFDNAQPDTGLTSGLDGKEDDIEGMNALTEVQSQIDTAKSMHNMRQNLPEYRYIFKSYHDMEDYYNKAKGNFWQSSICAINMLQGKYANGAKAWLGKDCTIGEEGHIYCHYQNNGAEPEEEGGTMSYDVACPDDRSKTCYVATFDNQGERRGISGYLLDLYDTAKEQDATAEVESSIVVTDETPNSNAYVTKVNVELQGEGDAKTKGTMKDSSIYVTEKDSSEGGYGSSGLVSLSSMNNQAGGKSDADAGPSNLKDPSLEDAINAETRKEELLPWTIGKEVISEVYKDLRSGKGKFAPVAPGLSTANFVWNDQILFYNQYIYGKYDNITKYINEEPFAKETLDLAEIINKVIEYTPMVLPNGMVAKTVEQIRAEHAKGIEEARKYFASLADRSDGIDDLLREQDAILDGAMQAQRNKMESYYKQKDALNEQLKNVNEQLSKLRDEYNRANNDITSSDVTTERAGEGNDYGEKLYEGRHISQKSPQEKSFSNTQINNAEVKNTAIRSQARIKASLVAYENQAKALKKMFDDLKANMNKARSDYVKAYSDLEIKQKKKLNKRMEDLTDSSNKAIEQMSQFASDNIAIDLANKAVGCVRGYASTQVATARDNIVNLQDQKSMHYVENAPLVQGIHKDMIKKITNIKPENLGSDCDVMSQFSEALNELNISDPMQPVYDIFKNLCKDGSCEEADSEYYLSFLGRKRDFMAPKAAIDFVSAPLREVFHFDMTDYGKIDKYTVDEDNIYSNRSITITAQSFLDSGLDIPEVWRYLLARRSFVERSIDLEELFGKATDYARQNTANREFLRGGIYPCQLNGKFVDVVKGKHSSSYRYTNDVGDNFKHVGVCQEVAAQGSKIVDKKSWAAPIYSAESNHNNVFSNHVASELGTILGYTSDSIDGLEDVPAFLNFPFFNLNRKLTFNDALQNALQIINHNEDLGDNPPNDALFYMSQRAFLDRNQFGDYLNQYEVLSSAKKMMDELEVQMQEVRESILFAIENTDFTLREDFDLTNSDDYKTIEKVLYDQKQVYMDSAKNGLSRIRAKTSNLKEKIEKAKHMLEVLKKDKNTVVAVSGEEDLDELEESIRNKQADYSVVGEYSSAADESRQNNKELMMPYCAVY